MMLDMQNIISLHPKLKSLLADLRLGVMLYTTKTKIDGEEIKAYLEKLTSSLEGNFTQDKISTNAEISALRNAYKQLGKDPSRYRGSAEALLRRIVQGKGIYFVNPVVDLNNIISLASFCSVGSYMFSTITPPVVMRKAEDGETYQGIGKGEINLSGLPIFSDSVGPFGSPTSDSDRTMIKKSENVKVMTVIISFSPATDLAKELAEAKNLVAKYLTDSEVETYIVGDK